MKNITNKAIEFESYTLRIAPGEYKTFPFVDNKGLFRDFIKTDDDFIFSHEVHLTEIGPVIGVYKKVGCFSVLVSAFYNLEEMNEEAKEILSDDKSMRDCIESTFILCAENHNF